MHTLSATILNASLWPSDGLAFFSLGNSEDIYEVYGVTFLTPDSFVAMVALVAFEC